MKKTYNKAMIELVYEIRRRVGPEDKPDIKLANPDLLITLVIYYQHCNDAILKALIKELMMYAGEKWVERLQNVFNTKTPKQEVNVYRGSVSIKEASTPEPQQKTVKPGLIYRGQPVKN